MGRHNAVDKVIGEQLLAGACRSPIMLQVSGRVSFEIVQKAAVAGSRRERGRRAVVARRRRRRRLGVTVIGFVRDGRCNVYTHAGRVT